MSENINTLIDLGSNNLKCAIFSYEGKKSNLIAFSEKKTQGIHNSTITNFDEACESLNSVISDVCLKTISGKGKTSYLEALKYLLASNKVFTIKSMYEFKFCSSMNFLKLLIFFEKLSKIFLSSSLNSVISGIFESQFFSVKAVTR